MRDHVKRKIDWEEFTGDQTESGEEDLSSDREETAAPDEVETTGDLFFLNTRLLSDSGCGHGRGGQVIILPQ